MARLGGTARTISPLVGRSAVGGVSDMGTSLPQRTVRECWGHDALAAPGRHPSRSRSPGDVCGPAAALSVSGCDVTRAPPFVSVCYRLDQRPSFTPSFALVPLFGSIEQRGP